MRLPAAVATLFQSDNPSPPGFKELLPKPLPDSPSSSKLLSDQAELGGRVLLNKEDIEELEECREEDPDEREAIDSLDNLDSRPSPRRSEFKCFKSGNGGGGLRPLKDDERKSLSECCVRREFGKGGSVSRVRGLSSEKVLVGLEGISCLELRAESDRDRGAGLGGSPMRVLDREGNAM